jgi:hypothetical protein
MKPYSNFDTANTKFRILKISGVNYLVAIACGDIDAAGLARMFRKAAELAPSLPHCRILIDLEAAKVRLESADVDLLFHALRCEPGPHKIHIAVVSSAQVDIFNPLCLLRNSLCRTGLKVAVFDDTKNAVAWLASAGSVARSD